MPEEVCQKLKKITTIDISNNQLETLAHFEHMHRIKRLLAKCNYVRELAPIKSIENIFEVDLEGNAVDSHKDFLSFIKNKNDLIVCNLNQNPIMVEITGIEQLNEVLMAQAPEMITIKPPEEVEEVKQLLGMSKGSG